MEGIVFDIQRFALHDGPGIRTTVFLKGCPLRCRWCHNPESWSFKPQLAFAADVCTDCLDCVDSCQAGVHYVEHGRHHMNWQACGARGACVEACVPGALRIIGEAMSVERVMDEVLRDAAYYRRSGGGVTLSGGEPLAQYAFARALLQAAKEAGLHTCLDTSGLIDQERLATIAGYVDLFLFDYKATDAEDHRRLTGVSNALILSNLDFLYRRNARIVLRCPLVPGENDSPAHLRGIATVAARYPELAGVELMAYHALARDKSERIGIANPLKDLPTADEATKAGWLAALREEGCVRARFG